MHTYTIRLMGDCLVEVKYPYVGWRGYIGPPRLPDDYEQKAKLVGLHPYWVIEMAYTYYRGYNAAITQESHRGA